MEPRPHADDINNIMRLPGDHQTQPNLIVDRSRRRRGEGRKRNNSLSLSLFLSAHVIGRSPKKRKKEKWTRASFQHPSHRDNVRDNVIPLGSNILFRLETFRNVQEN